MNNEVVVTLDTSPILDVLDIFTRHLTALTHELRLYVDRLDEPEPPPMRDLPDLSEAEL